MYTGKTDTEKMSSSLIIGIGGVSRSGKTTLAQKIDALFEKKTTAIINQDDYIHSAFQMPWIEDELDWEDPESLDFQRMYYEVTWLSKNVEILIIEGLFAFYYPALNKKYDRKILVEIDYNTFLKRKLHDERWGKVPNWYIKHIWESYLKFGLPNDMTDVHRINGSFNFDMNEIMDFINNYDLKKKLPSVD
jgi:uridine kinase